MKKGIWLLLFPAMVFGGFVKAGGIVPADDNLPASALSVPSIRQVGDISLRTNTLYWVMLTPNAGIEWQVSEHLALKADLGWNDIWNFSSGNHVWKFWYVNPEIRRYFGASQQLYYGLGFSAGHFNVKPGDTGYQGDSFCGGFTFGYVARLGERLFLDLNLGLGYRYFAYDTFVLSQGVRVYEEKNLSKSLFAPTQAGVSLVWRLGNK